MWKRPTPWKFLQIPSHIIILLIIILIIVIIVIIINHKELSLLLLPVVPHKAVAEVSKIGNV